MEIVLPLVLGFGLDMLLGDPYNFPHPVRLIGSCITKVEKICRKVFPNTEKGEYLGGSVLAITIMLCSFCVAGFLVIAARRIHPIVGLIIETILCYQMLAAKGLQTESMKVYKALQENDIDEARKAVSMIVGRDTANLTEEGVAKAAIETVAENTSDGVIAPMIYMAIGGAPLGMLYKAINTMDSMIGYKNEKYLYFGRAAAKIDDIVNFIPARISAWLMILSAKILGFDWRGSKRIYLRDRLCHPSPNSAQTESACAGALGIQLAGDMYYFGKLHHKPTIGDADRPVEAEDIRRANKLMYGTAWICLLMASAIRIIL